MTRGLLLALLTLIVVPAGALAAAKPGSYAGASSARYIQVGSATEPTDRGKVSFKVRKNKVLNFRMTGQQMNCGPAPEVPVSVKTIRLNSKGKGSAVYEDPSVGPLTVTIRVTSKGKASGTVRRPESSPGLCDPAYPARFTARRR